MFMCSVDTYRVDLTSPVATADERTPLEILKPISFAVARPERLATHSRRSAGHCDGRHVRRAADGSVAREGRFSPAYRRTGPQGSRRATCPCCSARGTERTLSPRLSETCIHIFGGAASRGSRSGMVRGVALNDFRAVCDYAAVSSQGRKSLPIMPGCSMELAGTSSTR